MTLTDFLSRKSKAKNGEPTGWLHFCTLEVTTGSLWAGDPWMANADDGCVIKVPRGRYVIEGIGRASGRDRIVSRLRVRLESTENPKLGKPLGETGTDSAMIGVCDIEAFDEACGPNSGEEVQQAIEAQTEKSFGIITLPKFPGAVMPFVPIGSDGGGPVHALICDRKRVGFELPLTSEVGSGAGGAAVAPLAGVLELESDTYITRRVGDDEALMFWLKHEPKTGAAVHLWACPLEGPIDYRVREATGGVLKDWSAMKKSRQMGMTFCAIEELPPGKYEFDFRVNDRVFSALKLTLA